MPTGTGSASRQPEWETIAVLGAGRVGTAVARAAMAAGYDVRIAASGPGEDIELLVRFVAPGARPTSAAAAVEAAGIVVLALPLHKYRTLDPTLLAGRIVIDAMNYWPAVDGVLDEFEVPGVTSSEVVASFLTGARLVKTLNHIGYHDIEIDAAPHGDPRRRALATASQDADAEAEVAVFLNRLGYDSLSIGSLTRSALLEPGAPIFGVRMTSADVEQVMGAVPAQEGMR